jgi:hypothetical protein
MTRHLYHPARKRTNPEERATTEQKARKRRSNSPDVQSRQTEAPNTRAQLYLMEGTTTAPRLLQDHLLRLIRSTANPTTQVVPTRTKASSPYNTGAIPDISHISDNKRRFKASQRIAKQVKRL